jgi:hypothetical protein
VSGIRKAIFGLAGLATLGLIVALIGVPLIPTSPCLGPGDPTPNLAFISLVGLIIAGFSIVIALSFLPSDPQGNLWSKLAIAFALTLVGGAAWAVVAILAYHRTKGWSCAGG